MEIEERLPKALVIVGDGTDSELLQEEGIGQIDAFVAITGLDEANILMSMSAAQPVRGLQGGGEDQPPFADGTGVHRGDDRQRGVHRRGDHRADPASISGP